MILGNGKTLPKHIRLAHIFATQNSSAKKDNPLGPEGMVTKDGFIISKEEWAFVQAYVTTGTGLPINDDEMRRHVGLPSRIQIPDDFNQLYKVYNEDKHLCSWWNGFLFPLVLKTANDISAYGFKCAGKGATKGYYEVMQDDVENISDNGYDKVAQEKAHKDLQARCKILIKEADQYKAAADDVSKHLNTFLKGGQDSDGNDVIGVEAVQVQLAQVKDNLDGLYGDKSPRHEELLKKVDDLKKELEAAIKAENELEKKVKMSFALGPLLGFVVYEILELTAVKSIHKKVEALQAELDTANDELDRDVKILGMMNSIDTDIDNMLEQGEQALVVFRKIAGIWSVISLNIGNLRETSLKEIEEENDDDALYIELGDAAGQWKEIAEEAQSFVLNAYTP
ncbi:alpha-xenorhabdolysin family binary toxin subunit A, partial [Bacillus thuringiensis]